MTLMPRSSAGLAVAARPGHSMALAQQYPMQDIRFTRAAPAGIGADVLSHSGGGIPGRAGNTAIFENSLFDMPDSHFM